MHMLSYERLWFVIHKLCGIEICELVLHSRLTPLTTCLHCSLRDITTNRESNASILMLIYTQVAIPLLLNEHRPMPRRYWA